jgi:hypothetical protein
LSWEQLSALAAAHRRQDARRMLNLMVAAQGDAKSWEHQRDALVKIITAKS